MMTMTSYSTPLRLVARLIYPAFVRQKASGRCARDHVVCGIVTAAAALDQPFRPVAHDRQGQAQETQYGGRECQ